MNAIDIMAQIIESEGRERRWEVEKPNSRVQLSDFITSICCKIFVVIFLLVNSSGGKVN